MANRLTDPPTLNLKKTKVMFFGMGPELNQMTYSNINFGIDNLEIVDKYKYLGVMLVKKLNFDQHVLYLHSKIYPKVKTLSRVRSQIGNGTALYLYDTLMNSLFTLNDYINASISNQ